MSGTFYHRLPPIASLSPVQAWQEIKGQVAQALDNLHDPGLVEECENVVGSLGPQYEGDELAVLDLMDRVNPQAGLDAVLSENPGFELDDPPTEIVATVVSALMSLRPANA